MASACGACASASGTPRTIAARAICRRPGAAARRHPAAPSSTSTAPPPARGGSGRGLPGRGAAIPRCSPALRPCDRAARLLSSSSIVRTWPGTAIAPPLSAIDKARLCSRLSSSTISATSSVIRASSVLRLASVSRPSRISRLSGILMFTSLSEQSTPGAIVDEVGVDAPAAGRRTRSAPAWVIARLAPSPMARARSSSALARIGVVGRVADVGMRLRRRFDVSADAAEPDQVDRARAGWH